MCRGMCIGMCLCAVFMRVENILRKEIVTFHFREKHVVSFTSKYTGTIIFSSLQFGLERVSMTAMAGRERRWSRGQEDGREREGKPTDVPSQSQVYCVTCQWVVYLWNLSLLVTQ